MTLARLASEICKREGGKSEARIHHVREILRVIVELELEAYASGGESEYPLRVIMDRVALLIERKRAKSAKRKPGRARV